MVIQPGQLFRVVLRRRLAQVLEVEPLDELLAREDLGIAMGPAQARQVIQHGFGQVAFVAVAGHGHGAVALAHLLALLVQHGRQVCVDRRGAAERADDVDLARGVVDVVVAADHVRDLHVEVVHHHAEVIGRGAVRARDHQVVELVVGDLDAALDRVVPHYAAADRVLEADHRIDARRRLGQDLARLGTPEAVVARLLAALALGFAQRVQFFGAHVAAVGQVGLNHLRHHLAIAVHALHLVERAFVDIHLQPGHAFQDHVNRFLRRTLNVGVFDAQDEVALHAAGEGPGIER
ncbi:hypothetical protein D9M72_381360 [compost metagenome]